MVWVGGQDEDEKQKKKEKKQKKKKKNGVGGWPRWGRRASSSQR